MVIWKIIHSVASFLSILVQLLLHTVSNQLILQLSVFRHVEIQNEHQNGQQMWGRVKRPNVAGARPAGLSISETADLLGLSHTVISRVFRERTEKEKICIERQFSGWKCYVNARGQGQWSDWFKSNGRQSQANSNSNDHSSQSRFAEN